MCRTTAAAYFAVVKNWSRKKILILTQDQVFLRFRFGDRKEILRDRLEEFQRLFSIDVISGHYILRDRWRNSRDRFGPSKHCTGLIMHVRTNVLVKH